MIILNEVQVKLICNTNCNLIISITDHYNTTLDRCSCHQPNRNK